MNYETEEKAFRDICYKFIDRYPDTLVEGPGSLIEQNLRDQFYDDLYSVTINSVPFYDTYYKRSEYPVKDSIGHYDTVFTDKKTGRKIVIEYKLSNYYSSSSKTGKSNCRRSGENDTAFHTHEDVTRLENQDSEAYIIFVTDNKQLYSTGRGKRSFREDLLQGVIREGEHIQECRRRSGVEVRTTSIRKDYPFTWYGKGVTKGFVVRVK